jgi:AraC family transcriptional regulator
MLTPETTSAETFWRYAGGKCLFESRGEAWREIKAWITALPPAVDALHIPAVSEPFLAWTTSGVVDFQERERHGQPRITHRIERGSFFLTSCGAPHEVRWRSVSDEPFESMYVFMVAHVAEDFSMEQLAAQAFRRATTDDNGNPSYLECGDSSPLFV